MTGRKKRVLSVQTMFQKRHNSETFHFWQRHVSETFHVLNFTLLKHSIFWTLCSWNIFWTLDILLLCPVTFYEKTRHFIQWQAIICNENTFLHKNCTKLLQNLKIPQKLHESVSELHVSACFCYNFNSRYL